MWGKRKKKSLFSSLILMASFLILKLRSSIFDGFSTANFLSLVFLTLVSIFLSFFRYWKFCGDKDLINVQYRLSCKKLLRIGGVEKLRFFSRPFWFVFASSAWKSVKIYRLAWMGLNFDDYPGFQLKITHAN